MSKLLIPVILLFVIACQQEPDEIIPQIQANCKITNGYYYGGSGGINDSADFTYVNNRISRVEGQDYYVLYYYTGSNITARKFFDKTDNHLSRVDTIQYNASNKITSYINWHYDDPFFWDTTRMIYTYQYAGDKIATVKEATTVFESFGITEDTILHYFTYDAAGNISKIVYTDASAQPFDSIAYTYDTRPNYFSVVHPQFYLFEPFFELHVGLIAHLPYFYSKNNVTGFRIYGTADYNITYGLDSLNHVTSVNLDGFDYMKYKYSCQ